MKQPGKAIGSAILLTFLFLVIQMVGGGILGAYIGITSVLNGIEPTAEYISDYLNTNVHYLFMVTYPVVLLMIWGMFKLRKVSIRDYMQVRSLDFSAVPFIACLAVALQMVGSMSNIAIDMFYPLEEAYESMNSVVNGPSFIISLLTVGIAAPLLEEFFFRGVIFNKLRNHMSLIKAAVIQALLFSIMHLNAAQAFPTFMMAACAAWVYYRYDTLWAPIVLHLAFNLFAVGISYAPESAQTIIGFVMMIVSVYTVIVLIKETQEMRKQKILLEEDVLDDN